MWDSDDPTVYMRSDESDTIVDTYEDQSEVETDHNHNYVYIS